MSGKNKRNIGRIAEEAVADFLRRRGSTILARNYHSRYGEIDLIVEEGAALVFVEVKYRSSERFGTPAAAVTAGKIKKILQTAEIYLYESGRENQVVRFDVAEVYPQGAELAIRMLENAFDADGYSARERF